MFRKISLLYSTWEQTELFSMRQVNVGLRFFAVQKNLTRPTWLQRKCHVGADLRVGPK